MAGDKREGAMVWVLALLSLCAILGIAHMKQSLELEDAEQAYYSQWWRLGYDDQPPLFTWLQIALNSLFGLSKFSLALLRGMLFASTIWALYALGKKLLKDPAKARLAVLSSALVPVFVDFAFRRLSHTLLLCLVVLLTALALARLIERKSPENYIALGLCLGIGMLTKYNFALFVLALALSAFLSRELARVLFSPKILLSLAMGLLLFSPHAFWLLSQENLDSIGRHLSVKMGGEMTGIPILGPLWSSFMALVKLAWPLILVSGVMLLKKVRPIRKDKSSWFFQLFLGQLAVLLLFFVAADVKQVETRWLLPLMLPYLVLWTDSLVPRTPKLERWGLALFIGLLGFQLLRSPVERILGLPSDNQYDYGPLSERLREQFPAEAWVVPNVTYGGQLRLLNSNRTILGLDDFSVPKAILPKEGAMVLIPSEQDIGPHRPLDRLIGYGPDKDDLYIYRLMDVRALFP